MGSSNSVQSTPYAGGAYGTQTGGTLNYGGTPMSYQNPGAMSPASLNPYAAAYGAKLNGLSTQIGESMPGSDWYQHMEDTQSQNLNTKLGNQYAAMGLSGSSAEMGAMSSANIQNENQWTSRQLGDSMKSAGMQSQLDQAGYGETMGIQGQYGNFEDAYNQSIASLMGVQQGANTSNNALAGQIGQAGLAAAGTVAGAYAKGSGGYNYGGDS